MLIYFLLYNFFRECPSTIYNRYPQKILVGFAETVVDAPSLQHCFDNCLNSRQLYGFKCASGMYYFEVLLQHYFNICYSILLIFLGAPTELYPKH